MTVTHCTFNKYWMTETKNREERRVHIKIFLKDELKEITLEIQHCPQWKAAEERFRHGSYRNKVLSI